jgi:hypothetical protein
MGLRVASVPTCCLGLATALLAAGPVQPARAEGIAAGFACGVMAPMAEVAALQRIATRPRAKPRRQRRLAAPVAERVPTLRAFFTCPAEPGQALRPGWRTRGPQREA